MRSWKNVQKVYKRRELIGIIIIVLLLLTGLFFDFYVYPKGYTFILVDNLDSVSLTVLQIQATIGTIIFSIIALISGSISESHMGVSIVDFYLNIKPWKLTQKRLIIITFMFCIIGVACHTLGCFNLVFSLLGSTLILVWISLQGVFTAFVGIEKRNQEIESYVNYLLEEKNSIEVNRNVFEKFVLNWIQIVGTQDKQTYEEYFSIFKKCMDRVWQYRTDEAIALINQQCYSMASCLLTSEKPIVKMRGIEFIQDIYNEMWGFIKKDIEDDRIHRNQYRKQFTVFIQTCYELIDCIDVLSVENIEKTLRWGSLIDSVLSVDSWIKYDENNSYKENDISRESQLWTGEHLDEHNYFVRHLGEYLKNQCVRHSIIDLHYWSKYLNLGIRSFLARNLQPERTDHYSQDLVIIYFNYCYGMISNGQEEVVKNGLYFNGMKNLHTFDNKYQVLLFLAVHCYVYYLAIRETDDCVSENVRDSALSILNDEEVENVFLEFLSMLGENSKYLDSSLFHQLYEIEERYELFPKYGLSKVMKMNGIVSDFYLFIVLLLNYEYLSPGLLERNVETMQWSHYIMLDEGENTRKMLTQLLKTVYVGKKKDSQISEEVGIMYDELETLIKQKEKDKYIQLAKNQQKNYKEGIDQKKICSEIRNEISENLKEKFAPIMVENDEGNDIQTVTLLSFMNYTDLINQQYSLKHIYSYVNYVNYNFFEKIKECLIRRNAVDFENRWEFNDYDLTDYLINNNLCLLMGSSVIFQNRKSKGNKRFSKEFKTIYLVSPGVGVALKERSIAVCLHNVEVTIVSPNIEDVKCDYNEQTQKYSYEVLEGLPIEFTEEELKEFIYNYRKKITITAELSIKINIEKCGTIFKTNSIK